MKLFTPEATYKVYMGDFLASDVLGTETLEKEFNEHAAQVKTLFTMNGQHTVKLMTIQPQVFLFPNQNNQRIIWQGYYY